MQMTPEEKSYLDRLKFWSERLEKTKAWNPVTRLGIEQQAYSVRHLEERIREVKHGSANA